MPDDAIDYIAAAPDGSPVKYCLGLGVISPCPFIEISAEEFRSIKQAMTNVFILLDTEEKFGMVIENYLDYQREILNCALTDTAWQYWEWSDLRRAKALVNRRLANLLTLARLYLDHIRHDVGAIYGGSGDELTRIIEATKVQYDSRLGYRVMEAVRNLLQHRSFPIAKIYWSTKEERRKETTLFHNRFSAHMSVSELVQDGQLKRSVLDELARSGREEIDVGPLIREYVEGLSFVHHEFRRATEADIVPWQSVIDAALDRYAGVCGPDAKPVVAFALGDEETTEDEVPVVRDGLDQLVQWRQRELPTKISRIYVSDEPL